MAHMSGNDTVPEISLWFPFTVLQIYQNVVQTVNADCTALAMLFFVVFFFFTWVENLFNIVLNMLLT